MFTDLNVYCLERQALRLSWRPYLINIWSSLVIQKQNVFAIIPMLTTLYLEPKTTTEQCHFTPKHDHWWHPVGSTWDHGRPTTLLSGRSQREKIYWIMIQNQRFLHAVECYRWQSPLPQQSDNQPPNEAGSVTHIIEDIWPHRISKPSSRKREDFKVVIHLSEIILKKIQKFFLWF